ncbi:MAG: ExeA family protein [Limnochordia bacterium]|jgi:type II secretory pathway predicted ATPase ExeA|nr:AAA family ATPase [Thermoproteota archaeon]
MRFLQFFGLKFNPFRKDVPIEQLFSYRSGTELRFRLGYLQETRGMGLVIGEPGVGKTTALRAYLRQLNPASYHVCYFALSTLNVREFLSGLAVELGEVPAFQRVKTIRLIQQTIQDMFHERKTTPVIVLDEMHLASNAVFDELRLILNFEMDSQNPYILILVAQPPIRAKLNLNTHTPLRQRIQVSATLRGLEEGELANYLSTRLAFAGNDEEIFQTQSISAIYSISNGLPRQVNNLATNCLIYACQQGERYVDEECVYQAANELKI